MKVVFVLFDSLRKKSIEEISTPNFKRLAEKSISFHKNYTGSLPCIPARRDIHTGTMHFLHRSWGPLEPFDLSFLKILREEKNTYSHLITDHDHYFSIGGGGYHNQFDSYEYFRGQSGEGSKAFIDFDMSKYVGDENDVNNNKYDNVLYAKNQPRRRNHICNRENFLLKEDDFPTVKCFNAAFEFIDYNKNADNWFLQLECFDPHEPFFAPERFRNACEIDESKPIADWFTVQGIIKDEDTTENLKKHYTASLQMCDEYLGRLLDRFDQYNLWKDTMLIVTTDHGILMGEHGVWGKNQSHFYEEISNIPLFVYHPDFTDQTGSGRMIVTQTPDLMPTILDSFEVDIPKHVTAHSLYPYFKGDSQETRTVVFGTFGGPMGITDGKHAYYRYPSNTKKDNVYEYTLSPQYMRRYFPMDVLKSMDVSREFTFSHGVKLPRYKVERSLKGFVDTEHALYDVTNDPEQKTQITNQSLIDYFEKELSQHLEQLDAPDEAYERFELKKVVIN